MTKRLSIAVFLVGLAACGGGGGGDFASLYDAPTGPSTGTLYGTWGGLLSGSDTRWVLEPDQITLANKCGDRIVGVVVAAEVDDAQIRVLESDDDGGETCFVRAVPGTFTVCPTDVFEPKELCFDHAGEVLTIYENDVNYLELTKLED